MNEIATMTNEDVERVRSFETMLLAMPQVNIKTDHIFHAGVYSRTVMIPAGVAITGVVIKIPTLLIVSGNAIVYIGGESKELIGYHIIKGGANRKQAFYAREDTMLTMVFASNAETIEDAENEFTDEAEMLITRKEKGI